MYLAPVLTLGLSAGSMGVVLALKSKDKPVQVSIGLKALALGRPKQVSSLV